MKIFLLTVMFLSGSAILIGLAGELRARARRRAPAAADYGAYCRILEAVFADWRGERRYYPACYHDFFEHNDRARIDYARTVAARLEREAGREPWGEAAGEDPERDFRMQYAWELCLCEAGRTA